MLWEWLSCYSQLRAIDLNRSRPPMLQHAMEKIESTRIILCCYTACYRTDPCYAMEPSMLQHAREQVNWNHPCYSMLWNRPLLRYGTIHVTVYQRTARSWNHPCYSMLWNRPLLRYGTIHVTVYQRTARSWNQACYGTDPCYAMEPSMLQHAMEQIKRCHSMPWNTPIM
jgi:hypothetical protein